MIDAEPAPDQPQSTRTGQPKPGPWRIADIVDGRKLRIQLTAAALDNGSDPIAQRKRALDLIHAALFRGRMIAQDRLEEGADGLDTAALLSARFAASGQGVNAWASYAFADHMHPTPYGHELIANFAVQRVQASGW